MEEDSNEPKVVVKAMGVGVKLGEIHGLEREGGVV